MSSKKASQWYDEESGSSYEETIRPSSSEVALGRTLTSSSNFDIFSCNGNALCRCIDCEDDEETPHTLPRAVRDRRAAKSSQDINLKGEEQSKSTKQVNDEDLRTLFNLDLRSCCLSTPRRDKRSENQDRCWTGFDRRSSHGRFDSTKMHDASDGVFEEKLLTPPSMLQAPAGATTPEMSTFSVDPSSLKEKLGAFKDQAQSEEETSTNETNPETSTAVDPKRLVRYQIESPK
ncbi:hypothetical protein MMC25_006027 [Agyrium rufum]|nr:hypothetical protein [Agyrium rufum]